MRALISGMFLLVACRQELPDDRSLLLSLLSLRYFGPRFFVVGYGSPSHAEVYSVNGDGQVTFVSQATGGNFPVMLSADPTLNYIRMGSNSGGGYLTSFSLNRSTGSLAQVHEIPATGASLATADHPSLPFVMNVVTGQVNVHPVLSGGVLGTAVGYDAGRTFSGARLYGNILYAADNSAAGTVRSYRLGSTGVLTTLQTMPSSATNQATVGIEPLGRFMYVSNGSATNQVALFSLDGNGSMSGPTFMTLSNGAGGTNFAFDPYGRYLFASRSIATNNLQTYAINQATGQLTLASMITSGTGPSQIVVDPAGRFLVHLDAAGVTMRVYSYSNGMLTPVTGSPFSIGPGTNPVALIAICYEKYAFGELQFN
ncbi:MAG TPA: beta-propeller fold lactonase family protein [Leptospiraceae bacterium]|jgi:6-phosphogluconolactonase (cycloisomerase 2 family)|nr:beta-propeller fold lactonase family protein [Leptospiraceae bacterium]HMW59062.1 beta-propeller fold lactonase family protein [Leptospiraceae bacterium]